MITTHHFNERGKLFQRQTREVTKNYKTVKIVLLDGLTLPLHKVHGLCACKWKYNLTTCSGVGIKLKLIDWAQVRKHGNFCLPTPTFGVTVPSLLLNPTHFLIATLIHVSVLYSETAMKAKIEIWELFMSTRRGKNIGWAKILVGHLPYLPDHFLRPFTNLN